MIIWKGGVSVAKGWDSQNLLSIQITLMMIILQIYMLGGLNEITTLELFTQNYFIWGRISFTI